MRAAEMWVLGYVLNALWQVPLVFCVAWLAAQIARRSGEALAHRIWAVAMVLEALLPACTWQPGAMLREIVQMFAGGSGGDGARVSVVMGAGHAQSGVTLPQLWLDAVVLMYAAVVLYFVVRLAISLYRTMRLRSRAQPVVLEGEARASFARLQQRFGVDTVAVGISAEVCGPVVLGLAGRMLLLPVSMLEQVGSEDFAAALAHEFAHLRRRDFAKNLAYELLTLPVAFHPARWLTRARVAASREVLCDALAADAVNGRQQYARSLLRLASTLAERTRSANNHAIGIFDANSVAQFERRVMNLTEKQIEVRGVRRFAMAAFSVVLGVGTCGSALAYRVQTAAPLQQAATQAKPPMLLTVPRPESGTPAPVIMVDIPEGAPGSNGSPVKILTPTAVAPEQSVGNPQIAPGVMAGNIQNKVSPVYPQAAKDAKIQGAVVLKAVIGRDGAIKDLQRMSGPEELAQSAIDAVKQWVYKPYLLNGQPIEVETTITVNYTLAQ